MILDQFNLEIERIAQIEGSYKDAVLAFSEEKEMEVEEVYELLNPIIQAKIKAEFITLNYIPTEKCVTKLSNFFKD
jgi:PHD/YefM family antitoxin component YafN of YafNO toxin-antitoxin module